MNEKDALNHYTTKWFAKQMHVFEDNIRAELHSNRSDIMSHFETCFKELCRKIMLSREREKADSACYISYSMLRVNFLIRKPLYLIEVFEENWFFSDPICEHVYEPDWITEPLFAFYESALNEHRKYGGKVNQVEVEKLMLIILSAQERHITDVAKAVLNEPTLRNMKEFQALNIKSFTITAGSYRGAFKILYEESGKK